MKLQTQYGKTAEWKDLQASEVNVVFNMWIKAVASAVSQTPQAVVESLERGDVIELRGVEWHDRIRRAVA